MKDYQPISCEYYDFIEHFAVRGEEVEIQYLTKEGLAKVTRDIIRDTRIRDGEEFIVLEKGDPIRMDHIVSLNEHILGEYNKC